MEPVFVPQLTGLVLDVTLITGDGLTVTIVFADED